MDAEGLWRGLGAGGIPSGNKGPQRSQRFCSGQAVGVRHRSEGQGSISNVAPGQGEAVAAAEARMVASDPLKPRLPLSRAVVSRAIAGSKGSRGNSSIQVPPSPARRVEQGRPRPLGEALVQFCRHVIGQSFAGDNRHPHPGSRSLIREESCLSPLS